MVHRHSSAAYRRLACATPSGQAKRVELDIWHNLTWSRYKGAVFTALARQVAGTAVEAHVTQIALTDSRRAALSDVAMGRFDYPHDVLFRESSDDISTLDLYGRACAPRRKAMAMR